jgi:hypothetical protein
LKHGVASNDGNLGRNVIGLEKRDSGGKETFHRVLFFEFYRARSFVQRGWCFQNGVANAEDAEDKRDENDDQFSLLENPPVFSEIYVVLGQNGSFILYSKSKLLARFEHPAGAMQTLPFGLCLSNFPAALYILEPK